MDNRVLMLQLGVLMAIVARVSFAGDLEPPVGVIESTMKPIEHVEPRTGISNADIPIVIDSPGSYYLMGHLTARQPGQDAITIMASDVTLDLMGFSIGGGGVAFADGIEIEAGRVNIEIRGGVIVSCSGRGIAAAAATDCRFIDLRIRECGDEGLLAGDRALVESCSALNNGDYGIHCDEQARILNCVADGNGNSGVFADNDSTIVGCTASGNAEAGIEMDYGGSISRCVVRDNEVGLTLGFGIVVTNCSSLFNSTVGVSATFGCTISSCTVDSNGTHGILVASSCTVSENSCSSNGTMTTTGAGIKTIGSGNRIESNSVVGNDRGIDITGTENYVVRNTAHGNTSSPFVAVADNHVAPIKFSMGVGVGPLDNFVQ